MKSIPIIMAALLALSGCTTTKYVEVYKHERTDIPASLTECPYIKKSDFPPKDATNAQLHSFISVLFKRNAFCAKNMESIRTYMAERNATIDKLNAKTK